jgi:hypothetical protein
MRSFVKFTRPGAFMVRPKRLVILGADHNSVSFSLEKIGVIRQSI